MNNIISLILFLIWSGSCIFCILSGNILMGLLIMFLGYFVIGISFIYSNYKHTIKSYKYE